MPGTIGDRPRAVRARGRMRIRIGAVLLTTLLAATAAPSAAMAVWKPTVGQVFSEQAASERMITALVDNQIASLYIGRSHRNGSYIVHAPVTARMRNGSNVAGELSLKRYGYKWYFYTITAGPTAKGVSWSAIPAGISSSALRYCVTRQSANQWFANGVRYGYFRTLTVKSVSKNWSTASVKFRLTGGSRSTRYSTMTCISQTSTGGKQYWFMTALK